MSKAVVAAITRRRGRGARCVSCHRTKSQVGSPLHFHHIDPSTKQFNVSSAAGKTVAEVEEEMDKCVLLCKKCHRDLHSEAGWQVPVIREVRGHATLEIIGTPVDQWKVK